MTKQMILYPYMHNNCWVFDDKEHGLKAEAFVCGMSEIISGVVSANHIKKAGKGFKLVFSDQPFDHDIELTWFKPGNLEWEVDGQKFVLPGNWYHTGTYFNKGPKPGWLCPALLKFFDKPPQKLYCKAERLPSGVDPIWHDVPTKFAYVNAA